MATHGPVGRMRRGARPIAAMNALSFGAPEWTERREQLSVSLLGDWILGEAESERFTGSPHLYGGVSGWQAARITSGRLEQSRTTERGLSPTLGGGLSAGVGPVSLRFMLTVSPQRDPMSEGLDPHLRGSWDLLVRPSTRSRTSR